jgi:hypothetical protein
LFFLGVSESFGGVEGGVLVEVVGFAGISTGSLFSPCRGSVVVAWAAFPKSCCLRFCSSSAQKFLLSEKRECVRRIC